MNYPKLKKIYVRGLGMVEVRPYLTTTEIDSILNKLEFELTDFAMRKMTLYSIVMSLCTDIKDFAEEEVSLEVTEAYLYNGIFDQITKHIKGFDILMDGFEKLPIMDVYARFEVALEEFTKQFKDIDLNKSMNDFEAKLNELKQVEAEKEAILNG